MKNKTRQLGLGGAALAALLLTSAATPAKASLEAPAPNFSAAQFLPREAGGWLGVSIDEVSPDQAKTMNLPEAYGVVVTELGDKTPAVQAGLKQGDIITEYNGQRIEGRAEFRRMVRETPPGRTAHLTVWRGGHSQKISAQIGQAPDVDANDFFSGRMPTPNLPPNFGFPGEPPTSQYGRRGQGSTPTLGVAAQDLSGQLGEYFGAPDAEGVLVTNVRAGSPGAKAGLRAGDVITKVDGQRIHNMGELREHLGDSKTVALTILRKGVESTVTAEPEAAQQYQRSRPSSGLRHIPL